MEVFEPIQDLDEEDEETIEKIPSESNSICYDTDLDIKEPKYEFDATGKKDYLETCRRSGAVPLSSFVRNLTKPSMRLRYYGMGAIGAYCISKALFSNTMIVELDLYENFLGPFGARAIANGLKENCYIANLNLGRNCLTSVGCKYICAMLRVNSNLAILDLSSNEFGDNVGRYLSNALKGNRKLSSLNLRSNDLGEKVGVELGPALNSNDALEHLDLSWNQIRGKGAVEIANGLWSNCSLRYLDLSWNGFDNFGALALADALTANNTLTTLDMSHNRVGTDGAAFFAKGISGNSTIENLKMDGNPIQLDGAFYLLASINGMYETALKELHLKEISVNKQFEDLYEAVKEKNGLVVHADFIKESALKRLNTMIEKDRNHWLETFEALDEQNVVKLPKDVFFSTVESLGLLLDFEEKLKLASKLKSDRAGNISYRHVLLGFSKKRPLNQEQTMSN